MLDLIGFAQQSADSSKWPDDEMKPASQHETTHESHPSDGALLRMRRIEELQSRETGLVSEQQKLTEDLAEAHERLMAETNAHQGSVERVEAASRELEMLKVELNAARQNIEKAQLDKARVCSSS